MKSLKKFLSKESISMALGILILPATVLLSLNLYFYNKIYPGITLAAINVSGLTKQEAKRRLEKNILPLEKITLHAKDKTFELSLSEIEFSYDLETSVESAFLAYRSKNPFRNLLTPITSSFREKRLGIKTKINQDKLNEYLAVVSGGITTEPVYPSVSLQGDQILIEKGQIGETPDTSSLRKSIEENLSYRNFSAVQITFMVVDPRISEAEAKELKGRAEKLLGKTLTLSYEEEKLIFGQEKLVTLLKVKAFNEEKIASLINKEVVPVIERGPQNAVFRYEEGKVIEFIPAKDGLKINQEVLSQKILKALTQLETSQTKEELVEIPVEKTPPQITIDKVNDLGIKQLLGRGTSKFAGSIASRVHNISLASSKFNGILVPPGEIFSFNDTLGDVSVFTGYKQAYIIKDGRTVLGDGGGVCQVSTTLFRAILDAGLPIVERRAHSYRVSYYEQGSPPGLDATVFAPTTDLKFKNNTPAYLLIQTQFNPNTLTLAFEIYGTPDGRVSTISKPVITSVTPPPEDLYVDDPNLPTGTLKQIDYKAWGAKVAFDYKVERNGETLYEKTFVSNYRPWQAVFLRGTGPIQ